MWLELVLPFHWLHWLPSCHYPRVAPSQKAKGHHFTARNNKYNNKWLHAVKFVLANFIISSREIVAGYLSVTERMQWVTWLFYSYLLATKPKTSQKNYGGVFHFLFILYFTRKSCFLDNCWLVNLRTIEKTRPHPASFPYFAEVLTVK